MYGIGILKGLGVTLKHFVDTFVDDIQWLGKRRDLTRPNSGRTPETGGARHRSPVSEEG